jgi:hypothetical protein
MHRRDAGRHASLGVKDEGKSAAAGLRHPIHPVRASITQTNALALHTETHAASEPPDQQTIGHNVTDP